MTTITFKHVESFSPQARLQQVLNGWYVRKNFKTEEITDEQTTAKRIKYSYDEAFLTQQEYEIFLIAQEITGDNYNSDAYLEYKQKLDTPVLYPENGNTYKPKWIKNAQGEDGVYLDYLNKGKSFPDLIYPSPIWESTNNPDKIVKMNEIEFMALVKFLGEVQEKYYTEYKIKKGQE